VANCSIREYRDRYFPAGVRVWVTRSRVVLLRTTQGGHCLRGRCVSFLSKGAENQLSEVWALIWGDIVKKKNLEKSRTALQHADPSELKTTFPNLAEFMTAASYDGGKERRESPTVTLWCTAGTWRASVKDRAEGLVLWLSAPGIKELLTMLDDFVLSEAAPWRHDEQSHERNGKRVKKGS